MGSLLNANLDDFFTGNKRTAWLDGLHGLQTGKTVHLGNRIVRDGYFADIHMSFSHMGLWLIAKKRGINLRALKPGEFVVFMNSSQTAFKMFTFGNTFTYTRTPHGEKINPAVIQILPRFWAGGKLDLTGALKKVLVEQIHVRRQVERKSKKK